MPLELTGRLKKAVDASNVRFEPEDTQDRLRITMSTAAGRGAIVADTMRLEYALGNVLGSLLPESVAQEYQQVAQFVWKCKTMEFNLQRACLVRLLHICGACACLHWCIAVCNASLMHALWVARRPTS